MKPTYDYFSLFIKQAAAGLKGNAKIDHASRDLRNALVLQKRRLDEHELTLEYSFSEKGALSDGDYGAEWSDAQFVNSLKFRTAGLRTVFKRSGRVVYDKEEKKTVYINVAELAHRGSQGYFNIDCPNCGSRITHKTIDEGCPFCGTQFKVENTYPKINNYYFINDVSLSEKEAKSGTIKWMVIVGIIFYAILVVRSLLEGKGVIMSFLDNLLGGILGGVVFGYGIRVLCLFGKAFFEAGKSTKLIAKTSFNPRKAAEHQMKRVGCSFPYDYFVSKVVYLTKMILFAKNPDDLAFVRNGAANENYHDIVDCNFRGAIPIKSIVVNDGMLSVSTACYMECFCDTDGNMRKKNQEYSMILSKKADTAFDFQYSVGAVKCRNCGGSFDAFLNKNCPYCGSEYSSYADDWIVTEFKKIK